MAIEAAKMEHDRLEKINRLSKCGGTSTILGRNSSKLIGSSQLNSEDRLVPIKGSLFRRDMRPKQRLPENDTKIASNLSSNLLTSKEGHADGVTKPESRLDVMKRNRSVDFKLTIPNLEYAEKSVELDDETVNKSKKGADFPLIGAAPKEYPGRLLKGFEIANVSKELAYNDSPYAHHLEAMSPLAKKRLKEFTFHQ